VKIEELLLAARKSTHVHNRLCVDAHSVERRTVRHWGDEEGTVVLETNEASIEQMINAGREQQTILSVEALFVAGVRIQRLAAILAEKSAGTTLLFAFTG
jgi:hypothetical protein